MLAVILKLARILGNIKLPALLLPMWSYDFVPLYVLYIYIYIYIILQLLLERDSDTLMLNNMITSQLTAHTHQLLLGTKTFHNYSLASADAFLKMQ